jgi:hypothetical protein
MTEKENTTCLRGVLGWQRRRPHGRYADSREPDGSSTLGVSVGPRSWSGRWRWRSVGAARAT